MSESNQNDSLEQLLRELGPAEPPADLHHQVMSRIGAAKHPTSAPTVIALHRRDMVMTRKVMWGLAAAAAVILAVFVVTGFPPVGRGTEGTVGAAKKYQAQQMTAADVKVGDAAAQQFLQSEVFDRLIKDREARGILASSQVREALRNDVIGRAIANRDIQQALASKELARLFIDAETRAELSAGYQAAASAAVRQASADTAARVGARAAIAQARADQQLAQVLNNAALVQALLSTNLYAGFARIDLVSGLKNNILALAALQPGFAAALATPQMVAALNAQ
jgi:hypothetical protein